MREFNITGNCVKTMHYMVDTTNKLNEVIDLIKRNKYFVINRPRQYGKTTTLELLYQQLKDKYLIIDLSFGSMSKSAYENETTFANAFYEVVEQVLLRKQEDKLIEVLKELKTVENFTQFSKIITKFILASDKEVILMIDEVDDGTNNDVFIKFLGTLRDKYLARNNNKDYTFKSVILSGVHDIKNLKYKVRGDDEGRYNSPWNIAADFNVDMSFNVEEIESMLIDYNKDQQANLDNNNLITNTKDIAQRIHYFTNGYPFLVSYLCKLIVEELDKDWSFNGIEKAVKMTMYSNESNFKNIIKEIANHEELYNLIKEILVGYDNTTYGIDSPGVEQGIAYGIITNNNGELSISNLIYQARIYQYLIDRMKFEHPTTIKHLTIEDKFINNDGKLNMDLILDKYLEYMNTLSNNTQNDFIEENAKLLFGLFIKPIINGNGNLIMEQQVRNKMKIDVTIIHNNIEYIIELKIWRGQSYVSRGIIKLCEYLDAKQKTEGYMIIHDFRTVKHQRFTKETVKQDNKVISIIYV